MAAEVSSLFRVLKEYEGEDEMKRGGDSTCLITMDLLGGGCSNTTVGSKELDLDLKVPEGWEKQLDMKSGKIYLQRCNSLSASDHKPELQDLNFPPPSLLEDSLDLKLIPSVHSQSVCTLDKVRSALERAEHEFDVKKRSRCSISRDGSSFCSSVSLSSIRGGGEDDEEFKLGPSRRMFAAACPGCLFYVLISEQNPKCPRCDADVPVPAPKKRRIDLNLSV